MLAGTVISLKERKMNLIKDRCSLLTDFYTQGIFFFEPPGSYDETSVTPKWNESKSDYFKAIIDKFKNLESWEAAPMEDIFKLSAVEKNIKAGELQLPFRIMLVGGKFGPPVFVIASTIGKEQTINRIDKALVAF